MFNVMKQVCNSFLAPKLQHFGSDFSLYFLFMPEARFGDTNLMSWRWRWALTSFAKEILCMIAIAIAALFQIRLKGNFVLTKKNFSHFNR
jgi:hypothetical protein